MYYTIKEYQIQVNEGSSKHYDDFELAKKIWGNVEAFIQARGGTATFKIRDAVFNDFNKLIKVETNTYCELEA